ncbi:dimethyl sulfoxide reductase anchor subunit [Enterobacteriaceae bacterium H18W14]|uniref:dimethyl sulfoxide reductase anchor subunit family protein n=1 Tax=Dryocola boscaweniae TaxID=2925397 RepID=UPI0022F050C5|nr:DmsC/YnfH family molybdoenzyme membrane anchor subunit [Dryocola boscaweniae]MCT4717058.1 dimethyl sulfoxide reductase anchor subunit [Dryocola boscaweniae]
MEEWPLIVFTLLVQASVGLTVAMSLFLLSGRGTLPVHERRRYLLMPLLIATIAAAFGLTASTLHLGYPLNAFNALRHVASSWLSREIIFASLYLAALGLAALLALFFRKLSLVLLLAACILGLVDVFCMGAIYVHSSVATWMHFNTWVMFYGATLSIGATAALLAFTVRAGVNETSRRKVAACVVAVLIVTTLLRLLEQTVYFSYLAKASLSEAITFPHQPLEAFEALRGWYLAGWIVLAAGVTMQSLSVRVRRNKTLLTAGCCAVFIAEILLRVVFFSLS